MSRRGPATWPEGDRSGSMVTSVVRTQPVRGGLMSPRLLLAGVAAAILVVLALDPRAFSQGQSRTDQFRQRSADAEKQGLAAPFMGVTATGSVEPGLFAIRSTGVTTEPVRKAAEAFLSGLTAAQRTRTAYAVDDPEWRKWMNQHFYVRQGVSFEEMSEAQRESAFAFLRASLSARGLKQTRDIMRLNQTLGELNNNDFEQYG